MLASFTTEEGYTLRAFSSLYIDYGLEILDSEGESLFYGPCHLSNDSYGTTYPEDEDSEEPGEPWSESRWVSCLRDEADTLLECFLPEEN